MKKPTTNIIHNFKRLKTLSLKSGTRQRCLPSPLFLTLYWKSQQSNQAIKIKEKHPHWNTRIKLSLFVNDMILYKENHIEYTHTHTHTHLLELTEEFSKILGNNINTKISCISIHNLKRKLRKQFYFQQHLKESITQE